MSRLIFPDGLDKAEHTLLQQILTVAPRQKVRTGAAAYQPVIARGQHLLRQTVPRPDGCAQRLVALCHQMVIICPCIIYHSALYLFTKEVVK